jgi:hypothetical protein
MGRGFHDLQSRRTAVLKIAAGMERASAPSPFLNRLDEIQFQFEGKTMQRSKFLFGAVLATAIAVPTLVAAQSGLITVACTSTNTSSVTNNYTFDLANGTVTISNVSFKLSTVTDSTVTWHMDINASHSDNELNRLTGELDSHISIDGYAGVALWTYSCQKINKVF